MLKRIIYFKQDKKSKGREKVISKISSPIEEKYITKSQLHLKDYLIVDDKNFDINNYNLLLKKQKNNKLIWNDKVQSVELKEVQLPFEKMTLEQKVDFLYNTLIKPTLPPDDEEEEEIEETDE